MASKLKSLAVSAKKLLIKTFVVEEYIEDKSIIEERLSICDSCEHLGKDMECRKCHCYMDIKAKTRINIDIENGSFKSEITHCPLGKWDDIDIANYYRSIKGKPLIQKLKHNSNESTTQAQSRSKQREFLSSRR